MTISWDRSSLLNLIVRRAIHNSEIESFYQVTPSSVLRSTKSQEHFFFRMCPDQVDVGPNKPTTLDWMLSRTRDGTKLNAPRELIHLLNSLRTQQIGRCELGEPDPEGEMMFSRPAFKQALPEVSKVRLEQTLYAESPDLREYIEKLKGERTSQRPDTLATIWDLDVTETHKLANIMVSVGFFELRGDRDHPEYWIPFLYRDSLNLIQGAAD